MLHRLTMCEVSNYSQFFLLGNNRADSNFNCVTFLLVSLESKYFYLNYFGPKKNVPQVYNGNMELISSYSLDLTKTTIKENIE